MSRFGEIMEDIERNQQAADQHITEAKREMELGHFIRARNQYDFARQAMTTLSDLFDDAVLAREEEREEAAVQSVSYTREERIGEKAILEGCEHDWDENNRCIVCGHKWVPEVKEMKPWRESEKPVEFEDETFGAGPGKPGA